MKFLKYHNIFWLLYFPLYFWGPIKYEVKAETFLMVFLLVLFGNIAYFFGYYSTPQKLNSQKVPEYTDRQIYREYRLLVVGTVVYLLFLSIKYIQLQASYGFNFSLEGFTELRNTIDEETIGGNVFGVISSALAGFPVLFIPFFLFNQHRLKKSQKRTIIILLIISVISTFTSGGRNAAFIIILVFFFSSLLLGRKIKKMNFKTKFFITAAVLGVMFIFSKIFIDRAEQMLGDLDTYIEYFEETKGFEVKPYAKTLLKNPTVNSFYFPVFMMHDYVVHSINEFEVTYNSSPQHFPYWGAYQFFSFALLMNKMGFETTDISLIISEIPNPGKYLTLFGGVYYDFGLVGTFIFIGLIYFLAGHFIRQYKIQPKYSNFVWFIYLYIIIFLSPIYDVISIAIYPSFLVAIFISLLYKKFLTFK